MRVVHPEDLDPGVDPLHQHTQALGVQAVRVVVEVERVDVLVLLRRVLGVGDRAVRLGGEPLRMCLDPRVIRCALQCEVQRHLDAQLPGALHERLEVGHGAEFGMDGVVATVLGPDRPGRTDVPRRREQAVVGTLAVGHADRVDGRQVDDVEAHARDVVEVFGRVLQRAVARRPRGRLRILGQLRADRTGEELVPGPVEGARAVDPDRVALRLGDQFSNGVRAGERLQEVVERGAHAVRDVEGGVAQRDRRRRGTWPLGFGQSLGQLVEDPRADLEVVGKILRALAGLDLDGDRVVPGRERIAPRLDDERPRARAVEDDVGLPAISADRAGPHANERNPGAVRAAQGDVGSNGVMSLAVHDRGHGYLLAYDGLGGKGPRRYDGGDRAES